MPPRSFRQVVIISVILMGVATPMSMSVVEYLPGFAGKLPFTLQTGYIGVGESEEIQLFYYFIESERSPQNDPLLLWLIGGPGCSGFSSLVYENGPLKFDYGKFDGDTPTLVYNPHTWTKVANIIFIDQPVGIGFSYAQNPEAYKSNDTLSGKLTYEFLQKWLINNPKYLKNPLYLAGGSYGGIILPLVVDHIYKGIDAGRKPHLNMKGYILGNPMTDMFGDINGRVDYAHRMGLLSDGLYLSAKESCNGDYINVDSENELCKHYLERVNHCVEKIMLSHILDFDCDLDNVNQDLLLLNMPLSREEHVARFLQSVSIQDSELRCRVTTYLYSKKWANMKSVQQALHIREGTITGWVRCDRTIRDTTYTKNVYSTVPYHNKFTRRSDCRALIFSGDHDMVAPHTATEEWIRSLKLVIQSDWRPWFVKDQIAGYTMAYVNGDYEMTYATVKGAGHTPPEYKPQECFALADRWLRYSPL